MTSDEYYRVCVQPVYLSTMPDDLEEDEEWMPHELVGPLVTFWTQAGTPELARLSAAVTAVYMHPWVLGAQVHAGGADSRPHEYRRGPEGVYHDTGRCHTCRTAGEEM